MEDTEKYGRKQKTVTGGEEMLGDLKEDGQVSSEILVSRVQSKQKIVTMGKAAEETELLLLRCSKCCDP